MANQVTIICPLCYRGGPIPEDAERFTLDNFNDHYADVHATQIVADALAENFPHEIDEAPLFRDEYEAEWDPEPNFDEDDRDYEPEEESGVPSIWEYRLPDPRVEDIA